MVFMNKMKSTTEPRSQFESNRQLMTIQNDYEDLGLIQPFLNLDKNYIPGNNHHTTSKAFHTQELDVLLGISQVKPPETIISIFRKYGWQYLDRQRTWIKNYTKNCEITVSFDELKKITENILSLQSHANEKFSFDNFLQNLEENILMYRLQRELNQLKSVEKTLTTAEDSQNLVNWTKKIPKYFGTKTEIINYEILSQFAGEINQTGSRAQINFDLTNDPTDPSTSIVSMTASENETRKFSEKVQNYLYTEISSYNTSMVLKDPRSFQFDVKFSNDNVLGFYLSPKPGLKQNNGQEGLLVSSLAKDSQAEKLLGNSVEKGAVLTSINHIKVFNLEDVKNIVHNFDGEHIIVTMCMSKFSNLSHIDDDVISGKDGILIKRLDGTVARRITDNSHVQKKIDDEDKLELNTLSQNATRGKQNMNYYRHFVEKFQAARDIEFKNTGILGQSANKSMWKQHKLIFGEKCDDSCPCPSDSRRISQSVVDDYLIKHRKKGTLKSIDPSLRSGENPVGFLNNFIGKFYKKVSNEFPQDSPRQVLDKLVSMWSSHKYERRYGLQCKESCSCTEAWSNIFLKSARSYAKSKKRELTTLKNSPTLQRNNSDGQNENLRSIPKKRIKLNGKEFHIVFNPRKPLGFCCDTKNGKCVVESVCPTAKLNDLARGAIVSASASVTRGLADEKKNIESHFDLQKAYNAAKMNDNTRLKLWFVGSTHTSICDDNKWSETGAWRGDPNEGWPGGASIVHVSNELTLKQRQEKKIADRQKLLKDGLRDAIQRKKTKSKNHLIEQQVAVPVSTQNTSMKRTLNSTSKITSRYSQKSMDKNLTQTENDDYGLRQQSLSDMNIISKQNELTSLASSLRSSKRYVQGRERTKVTFANDLVQTKYFSVDDSGTKKTNFAHPKPLPKKVPQIVTQTIHNEKSNCIRPDENRNSVTPNNVRSPTQSKRRNEVNDMVFIKNYAEVIDMLYADNRSTEPTQMKKNLLNKLKETKKQYVKDFEKSTSNFDEIKKKKIDIELKEKAVKIFIQAEYLIVKASSLDEWIKIEYVPLMANDLVLSKVGQSNASPNFLFCEINIDNRKYHSDMLPFNSMVNWAENRKLPKHLLEYNPQIGHNIEERKIVIELMKGVISGSCIALGSWQCSLMELATKLKDSQKQVITQNLSTSRFMLEGSLAVEVRCFPFDEKDRKNKINEARKELTSLIDWIISFERETSHYGESKQLIDMNLSFAVCGNLSLLHTAVYLGDILSINRLLQLGANPNVESSVGSAVTLAKNIYNNPTSQQKLKQIIDILEPDKRESETILHDSLQEENVPDVSAQNCTNSYSLSTKQNNSIPDIFYNNSSSRNNTGHPPNIHPLDSASLPIQPPILVNNHSKDISPSLIQETESKNNLKTSSTQHSPQPQLKETRKKINDGFSNGMWHASLSSENRSIQESPPNSNDSGRIEEAPFEPKQEEQCNDRIEISPFVGAKFRNLSFLAQSTSRNCKWETEDEPIVETSISRKPCLPTLDQAEWVDNKFQLCSFFASKSYCRFGKNCKNAHVNRRLGNVMHDKDKVNEILNEKVHHVSISLSNFRVLSRPNKYGVMWFTAAYVDPESGIIYKAENTDGFEGEGGEFWYENKHAAQTAAKHVYLVSKYFEWQNDSIYCNDKNKRKFTGGNNFSNKRWKTEPTNESIFHALVRHHNLQNVFVKIHPEYQLKRSCWTIKPCSQQSGYLTATFHSPVPSEQNTVYRPSNAGGLFIDGEWYYRDQHQAKAATLANYISFYMSLSLITEDFVNVRTGKKILS